MDTISSVPLQPAQTQTQFGKRAFSLCGPKIWNQIFPNIRNHCFASAFLKAVKTYLFLQLEIL